MQELKVWNHPVAEAQQFSEDYMDDSLSNRALTKGLPPTNLSCAEFVGMRVKTLSFLSIKNQKEYDIFLPGKTPDILLNREGQRDLIQTMKGSLSKAKVEVRKAKAKTSKKINVKSLFTLNVFISSSLFLRRVAI